MCLLSCILLLSLLFWASVGYGFTYDCICFLLLVSVCFYYANSLFFNELALIMMSYYLTLHNYSSSSDISSYSYDSVWSLLSCSAYSRMLSRSILRADMIVTVYFYYFGLFFIRGYFSYSTMLESYSFEPSDSVCHSPSSASDSSEIY